MAVEVETAPAFPTLFNSVTSDLKNSQQTWENVTKTAGKLSTQLLTTATALSHFIDQIQSVGDSANNIKGASRDIGASLTRFCMRQRSIENHIRSLANALSSQFCESMEKKSDEWKKKVTDIERRRGKCFKKSKQKKYFSQADLIAEQREGCLELLFEQRNQFAFFVNAMLPILDIEINLLDEGEHVKQVRDSMDQMVNGTDPQQVVFNSMEDFCLNSERRMISPAQSVISSVASGGLDRTISPSIDSFYSTSRNSTISGATYSHYNNHQRQYVPVSQIFQSSSPTITMSRPPLPKQPGYYADGSCSSTRGSSQTEVNVPVGLSISSTDQQQQQRRQRPLSFSGGDMNVYSDKTLKMVTTPGERSSASLIAETLQQIDQLGVELDSYCNTLQQDSSSGVGSSSIVSSIDQNGSTNYIDSPIMGIGGITTSSNTPIATPPTYRQLSQPAAAASASIVSYAPSQTSSSSIGSASTTTIIRNRPPPPERRNSTIQTASTFAPSIADLRTLKGDYGTVQFRDGPPPRYPGPGYKHQHPHHHPPPPPNYPAHSFK